VSNTPKTGQLTTESTIFAVDFAALAREIAMDVFDLQQILDLHKLSDEEWMKISDNPKFQAILKNMIADWESAANTRERVKIKAATGLESVLEPYIAEIQDTKIPLAQRVEAGKFLARLGELDGNLGVGQGDRFQIVLNMGTSHQAIDVSVPKVIDHVD
jgi:hypothetical protein